MSELGPVSQAILDYLQSKPGYIQTFRMIHDVALKTGESHSGKWYFRRLVCLAFEGRIEAMVSRKGDHVGIRFRRRQENVLEEIPQIEEAEG